MVDVEDVRVVAPQEVGRHPIDVPAVEEDDHAVDDVDRRLVEHALQRQEAILDRERKLLRRQEHDRVLAELAEDAVHGQKRAERIAVRALVGCEQEAIPPRRASATSAGEACCASVTGRSSRSRIEQLGEPHSALGSLVVVEGQGRGPLDPRLSGDPAWRTPCEELRPASVASRSASSPSTLTWTFAARRSGLVWTEVTVTNPIRGSSSSRRDRGSDHLPHELVTLLMRSVGMVAATIARHCRRPAAISRGGPRCSAGRA